MNWKAFEQYMQTLMREEHIAGASVAVSKDGEVIYQKGFGVRNIATGEPVTPETMMGIASISKSFTALAIMRMAADGLIKIEDPVIKYLPEFKLKGVADMSTIKIHHLLSHTTGLPPVKRRQDIKFFAEHLRYLSQYDIEMLGEPGAYFSYANDMFLLLGALIERLTGYTYTRYMTRLLDELEMKRSTYYVEELQKFKDVTVPYVLEPKTKAWQEAAWPQLGVYEVGGGVRSCVSDLLHYGEMFVQGGQYAGQTILPQALLQKMWQPVYEVGRGQYYGYALKSMKYNGVTLVEHGGSQPGVASNFGFVPEEKLVVAVLTNVTGVPSNSIWLAAVNTALNLPLEQLRSVEPQYKASTEEKQRFVGAFQSDEGGAFEVSLQNGQLIGKSGVETYTLRVSDAHTLVINEKKIKNVVKFYFHEHEAKAWAVFVGSRMLRRVQ